MGIIVPGGSAGGSGTVSPGQVLIQTVTLGVDTGGGALWTPFTAIPQTYSHLLMLLRLTKPAAQTGLDILFGRVNGDTAAGYNCDATYQGANFNMTSTPIGNIWNSLDATACEVLFPFYTNTTGTKMMVCRTTHNNGGGNIGTVQGASGWQGVAAITSIGFFSGGSNVIQAGSKAWLYGIS